MSMPFIFLFGISGGELLILLLVVLLLFGPRKIPEIARMIGKGMNEVRKVQREINTEIHRYSGDIEREAKTMESEIKEMTQDTDQSGSKDHETNDADKTSVRKEGEDNLPYPYSNNTEEK